MSNTRLLFFIFLPLHKPSLQCVEVAGIFLFWIIAVNFLCRNGLLPSEIVYFLIDTGSLILNDYILVHRNHSSGSLNPFWLTRLQKYLYQNNVTCHGHSKQSHTEFIAQVSNDVLSRRTMENEAEFLIVLEQIVKNHSVSCL